MRSGVVVMMGLALGLVGCEKAGPKASGKLGEDELALLARLPNKFDLALGGNLPRLQGQLAKSPLTKMSRAMPSFEGSAVWQECLGAKPFKQMLGVADARRGFDLRMVMTGLTMADLEGCAKQAKLAHQVDQDRKFITIEVGTELGAASMPYLVLDDGALYVRMTLGAATTPQFEKPSRAMLEADLAAAKADNAAMNATLIATMEKADRQKGMWFAGSAEGTPLGGQVHELFGTLDLEGGLEIDATVEMANSSTTKKVMDAVEQARDAGGLLGSDLKKVIDALEVRRDGDRVRFALKVSNAQLDAAFAKLAPMMGGSRPRGRVLEAE